MLIIGPFVSEVFFDVISASISGEGLSIMSRIKKRRSNRLLRLFLVVRRPVGNLQRDLESSNTEWP